LTRNTAACVSAFEKKKKGSIGRELPETYHAGANQKSNRTQGKENGWGERGIRYAMNRTAMIMRERGENGKNSLTGPKYQKNIPNGKRDVLGGE